MEPGQHLPTPKALIPDSLGLAGGTATYPRKPHNRAGTRHGFHHLAVQGVRRESGPAGPGMMQPGSG